MLTSNNTTKKILVIVAHPDDEVLGCGGTISKHIRNKDEVHLLILSDGELSREVPELEKRSIGLSDSCSALGLLHFKQLAFNDSKLDTYPLLEIIRAIETFAKNINPHIVYTHSSSDINQDHRATYMATLTAFRPLPDSSIEKILTFEIPSSTECGPQALPRFTPNYFESLTDEDITAKFKALNCYRHELREFPHPRSLEYIKALLTVRGSSVGVRAAEAFFLERLILR